MPQAASDEHFSGRQMEVVAGSLDFVSAARLVMEIRAAVGLVGTLVGRESRVAIDPEHRSADRPRIGEIVARDLSKPRREALDEPQHRVADLALEAALVGPKPIAVVVRGQLAQEAEEARREVGLIAHRGEASLFIFIAYLYGRRDARGIGASAGCADSSGSVHATPICFITILSASTPAAAISRWSGSSIGSRDSLNVPQ